MNPMERIVSQNGWEDARKRLMHLRSIPRSDLLGAIAAAIKAADAHVEFVKKNGRINVQLLERSDMKFIVEERFMILPRYEDPSKTCYHDKVLFPSSFAVIIKCDDVVKPTEVVISPAEFEMVFAYNP